MPAKAALSVAMARCVSTLVGWALSQVGFKVASGKYRVLVDWEPATRRDLSRTNAAKLDSLCLALKRHTTKSGEMDFDFTETLEGFRV